MWRCLHAAKYLVTEGAVTTTGHSGQLELCGCFRSFRVSQSQAHATLQQRFPMYQLKLHPNPKDLSVISSSLHRFDPSTRTRKGLSPVPSRVSPEGLSSTCFLNWNSNGRRNDIRARLSIFGLSSRGGGFLRGGEERVRFSTTSTSAYREEDWAKLFQPEALNKEELKEYLNEDPVWLWVFKSWHSGIKGALLFLWTQPGQIKYIEWPSVKSTVKMALLTLVVVMFLMVFLYTVDSLFRHMLKSSMKPIA